MANPAFYYDSVFSSGTLTASSTAAGDFNVANIRDWRPYTWWKATAVPATITRDLGSPRAADYMIVYGDAATYEARGSTDNFAASDVLLGTLTLTELSLGLVRFNSASYRYWRLRQTGTVSAVAIVAIGAALNMPVGLMSGDFTGRKAEGRYNRSMKGLPLGRVLDFEEFSESLSFRNVTWAWHRSNWVPAWESHLGRDPFVFAWDPANYASEIYLVCAKDSFSFPQRPGGFGDLNVEVSGVFL